MKRLILLPFLLIGCSTANIEEGTAISLLQESYNSLQSKNDSQFSLIETVYLEDEIVTTIISGYLLDTINPVYQRLENELVTKSYFNEKLTTYEPSEVFDISKEDFLETWYDYQATSYLNILSGEIIISEAKKDGNTSRISGTIIKGSSYSFSAVLFSSSLKEITLIGTFAEGDKYTFEYSDAEPVFDETLFI
ncbi:MAG: hypothetical protein LBM99_05505 [Bacillales bacterium]|jgi:hypothetical protein|nr:hypothetical protein [Bacillales bacterium]